MVEQRNRKAERNSIIYRQKRNGENEGKKNAIQSETKKTQLESKPVKQDNILIEIKLSPCTKKDFQVRLSRIVRSGPVSTSRLCSRLTCQLVLEAAEGVSTVPLFAEGRYTHDMKIHALEK